MQKFFSRINFSTLTEPAKQDTFFRYEAKKDDPAVVVAVASNAKARAMESPALHPAHPTFR